MVVNMDNMHLFDPQTEVTLRLQILAPPLDSARRDSVKNSPALGGSGKGNPSEEFNDEVKDYFSKFGRDC